jgi:hypothetical protein
MSNLHVNLDEANKHDPKGFIPALNNTILVKSETGSSLYEERMLMPKAINFVDGTLPPPTNGDYDAYVLIGGPGTIDGGWGNAAFGDMVRFLFSIPAQITPLQGYLCYDDTAAQWMEYNGAAWAAFGGGGAGATNLGIANITANNLDVTSDTGTDATVPTATASDAGLMPASKFNEVVANNAKIGLTDGDKGDITVSSSGAQWDIDNDVVTYAKIQNVTDERLLGNFSGSAGDVQEYAISNDLQVVSGVIGLNTTPLYISDITTVNLLDDVANWDLNGNYTGTAIIGTFQGQHHVNSTYWFTCTHDNIWIRMARI